ncbi:hypothetical protein HDU85_007737 [Gaertneriomyces sp. JEL0708]|nr:hypothetical protein HDU85_007737 [Gaertneriomyces sp. JEL0708]
MHAARLVPACRGLAIASRLRHQPSRLLFQRAPELAKSFHSTRFQRHTSPTDHNESQSECNERTTQTLISIPQLLKNNKEWAEQLAKERPGFFEDLAKQQNPQLLWIGCSDSRVPANQLMNLLPGEVFVHRNIANIVHAADLNSHSVLQYAVDVLKVRHIIVCGHYGCGGVAAALTNNQYGLVDHWIRTVKDLYSQHEPTLRYLPEDQKLDRLIELNVVRSVQSVAFSTICQNAWSRGQPLSVHGWVYRLNNGRIKDLGFKLDGLDDLKGVHRIAEPEGETTKA